jgi:hypothetical protein
MTILGLANQDRQRRRRTVEGLRSIHWPALALGEFRFFFRVQVIEIAEEFVESVHGWQDSFRSPR